MMTRTDRLVAWLAILVFGLPSLLAGLFDVRVWPFHNYDMFTVPINEPYELFEVVGIPVAGEPFTFDHQHWLFPVGRNGLDPKMRRLLSLPDAPERFRAALQLWWQRYHESGAWLPAKRWHGPLQAVELKRTLVCRDEKLRVANLLAPPQVLARYP